MKYRGILASSSDPTGQTLSVTVQGIIIGLSSVIVFMGATFFHVQIQAADISTLATEVGTLIGAVVVIYGLVRKVINAVGTTTA